MELGEYTWDALGVIVLDYEYGLTSKSIFWKITLSIRYLRWKNNKAGMEMLKSLSLQKLPG